MQAKNRFAAAGAFDDSDDEPVQKQTKTQKKKEERKVEPASTKPKVSNKKMEEGGFELAHQSEKPKPQRGGAQAARGGRGRGGDRPRTAYRTDADGNKIGNDRKERQPFRGKAREDAHPYDRRSGTGRGRRPTDKKDGAAGNRAYKKKGDEEQVAASAEKKEEEKVAKEPEVTETVIEERIGFSLEEYFADKKVGEAK